MIYQFASIGILHTCYKEKFGIPRQSNLVEKAPGTLVFHPEYAREEAVRGLEGFSHVWLIFVFHEARPKQRPNQENRPGSSRRSSPDSQKNENVSNQDENVANRAKENTVNDFTSRSWSPMVRPPRLGGNKKVGVFASRSPFRPNPIGMSVVQLESVVLGKNGPRLHLTGVDILDQTPILDVKPYIPYSDGIPDAEVGFAPGPPRSGLTILFTDSAKEEIRKKELEIPNLAAIITGILENDPRPAYRRDKSGKCRKDDGDHRKVFGIQLFDFDLRWRVEYDKIIVLGLVSQNNT